MTNDDVAERIVKSARVTGNNTVLEIGPGTGMLTKHLLEKAGKVIAVEKDDALYEKLRVRFAKEIVIGKLDLVHWDIIDFDLNRIAPRQSSGRPAYRLVANIPYNITGLMLRKFLEAENKPTSMTLMVQKEVAERVVGEGGRESILSISVKTYGRPEIIEIVGRENFDPTPKVDSAILQISHISSPASPASRHFLKDNDLDEHLFFSLVKTGFSSPRRQLKNNLVRFKINDSARLPIGQGFTNCGLEPSIRAEKLSREDWACLYKQIHE